MPLKDNTGAGTLSADVTVDMILNLYLVSSHEHKPRNGVFLKDLHGRLSDLLLTAVSFTSQLCWSTLTFLADPQSLS